MQKKKKTEENQSYVHGLIYIWVLLCKFGYIGCCCWEVGSAGIVDARFWRKLLNAGVIPPSWWAGSSVSLSY
jgi:hypothetical protein